METLRDPCPICMKIGGELRMGKSFWRCLYSRPSSRGPNFAGPDATTPLGQTKTQLAGGKGCVVCDRCRQDSGGTPGARTPGLCACSFLPDEGTKS